LATSLFKSVCLAMSDGASHLNPAIPAPTDDLIPVDEDCTNWHSAFSTPLYRFSNCGLQEFVEHFFTSTLQSSDGPRH